MFYIKPSAIIGVDPVIITTEDDEFEVTAEMLIHEDVDDEQTLAEAEAELSVGEVEEEVSDLQQVS